MIFNKPVRRFTLFLRRFKALHWNDRGCLTYTTWWQWGARHFRIRSMAIMRQYFSDWEELQDRVVDGDLDACLIYSFVERSNNSNLEKYYNQVVTETRNKYQV